MIDYPSPKDFKLNLKKKEDKFKNEVIRDLWLCMISREASILGRREVLTGKAKFGILGDGKELAQVAMAKAFKKGDFRSGYYRDQTFMFALGLSSIEDFFAQIYADSDNDPFSGGRQMNSHFATPFIDGKGNWTEHKDLYNISSDISSTGGQMARALGLALASKKYRELHKQFGENQFSEKGNEVCFCTIGDSSTSEGVFWETMNAAAVMKVPLAVSVWDDGYGISVPIDLQTTKKSISKALGGFLIDDNGDGIHIYNVKAWDYPELMSVYERAINLTRKTHIPALIHVEEVTQPLGHSTSGSHERYKSKERLQWEEDMDCIEKLADWMVDNSICSRKQIDGLREQAKKYVRECKNRAWANYMNPNKEMLNELNAIFNELVGKSENEEILSLQKDMNKFINPVHSDIISFARRAQLSLKINGTPSSELDEFIQGGFKTAHKRYHTNLYSSSEKAAINVPMVPAEYADDAAQINGYQLLNKFFDILLERDSRVMAFGEDVGYIGDVNQGFAGMQEKYGVERVFDCGIREWTIMGQAIGLSMRGLRPIAEIQYLDYLIYGMSPLSDDLASLRYRSNNLQQAPAIIRTRGHRLEGIWHAGSPLGMLINSLRGIYIMVPRNMTQAVGFYNTMMQSDDPGLIIECLNGYRLKETEPSNIGEYTVPLGVPEVLEEGEDVTIVTYGSCVRIVQAACERLSELGVEAEVIDVQTLLPFDLEGVISQSLKKTSRLLIVDEDVPGGASAYIQREILEVQGGYYLLDAKPVCLTAHAHRPPYGSEGDYYSKPNEEDVVDAVLEIIAE